MVSVPPKVLISYSHDSPEHEQRVLELADRLRADGIDCTIDQYVVTPAQGWPRWMDKQIRDSDFVVMVCTETYYQRVMGEEEPGKGLGVRWEGHLIYQAIYRAESMNTTFIPVLFESGDNAHIPAPLQSTNYYSLDTRSGYEDLYRRLTNQPRAVKPELGKPRSLPPAERRSEGAADPKVLLSDLPIDRERLDAERRQREANDLLKAKRRQDEQDRSATESNESRSDRQEAERQELVLIGDEAHWRELIAFHDYGHDRFKSVAKSRPFTYSFTEFTIAIEGRMHRLWDAHECFDPAFSGWCAPQEKFSCSTNGQAQEQFWFQETQEIPGGFDPGGFDFRIFGPSARLFRCVGFNVEDNHEYFYGSWGMFLGVRDQQWAIEQTLAAGIKFSKLLCCEAESPMRFMVNWQGLKNRRLVVEPAGYTWDEIGECAENTAQFRGVLPLGASKEVIEQEACAAVGMLIRSVAERKISERELRSFFKSDIGI
jgi:hypothetical protein